MPEIEVIFYSHVRGEAPLLNQFDAWPQKVREKCIWRIQRLEMMGYELRRPEADFLRDGIYELRIKHMNINYRILYFFHNQTAVLFDGLTKEDAVPSKEIDRAVLAKAAFAADPDKHTYEAEAEADEDEE